MPLDIKTELDDIRKLYTEDLSRGTFNALVLGQMKSGKTVSLTTLPRPVLVHSFDPGGWKSITKEIDEGWMYVEDFSKDDAKRPTEYERWEKRMDKLRSDPEFFKHIGSFVIDSCTTWLDAMKNYVAKKKARPDGCLALQDWQPIGNTLRDWVKLCTALPCNFIMTGHITRDMDEIEQREVIKVVAPPMLQINWPILFDEIYCIVTKQTSSGIDRKFQTQNNGQYVAGTRIGRGKFEVQEEIDFKKLLTKAGLSTADKE